MRDGTCDLLWAVVGAIAIFGSACEGSVGSPDASVAVDTIAVPDRGLIDAPRGDVTPPPIDALVAESAPPDSTPPPPDSTPPPPDLPPPPPGAFCENNGRVSMEAEHFTSQVGYAVVSNASASGGSVVQVGSSGQVDYKVQLATGGIWYVWVRTYATHPEDNGMFIELDGTTIEALSGPHQGTSDIYLKKVGWSWAPEWQGTSGHSGPITIQASAGLHTLSIRKRKVERPLIDKIVLTTANNEPSKMGPAETPCAY